MERTSIGDRMKRYEASFSPMLVPRMPIIIRIDGRAFHTFTRNLQKPFDKGLMSPMQHTMMHTSKEMQGFKAAYTQSDEISFLLTDYDKTNTQGWFNYELNKIVSTSAAVATSFFNRSYDSCETFDARAFNVPREDVVNYFLWRAKDWARNSLQMYARSFFSQKELHNKDHVEIHEMLHKIEKNWTTDLSGHERNGLWYLKKEEPLLIDIILPTYSSINEILEPLLNEEKTGTITESTSSPLLLEKILCPKCKKYTHGGIEAGNFLSQLGAKDFPYSIVDQTIALKCHHCEHQWPVYISVGA